MNGFTVVIADGTLRDIKSISTWVAEHESVETSDLVVDALFAAIESLTAFPNRGVVLPEFEGIVFPVYRQCIVHGYRIIYRVSDSHVYVLSIVHQRRDLQSAIRNRLINAIANDE